MCVSGADNSLKSKNLVFACSTACCSPAPPSHSPRQARGMQSKIHPLGTLFNLLTAPYDPFTDIPLLTFLIDGHGYEKPGGFAGMGQVGVGVGGYIYTCTKPAPVSWVSWVWT